MLPTLDDILHPAFELIAKHNELKLSELLKKLREYFASHPEFKTTEEEFNQMVPSKAMPKFNNRVSWATVCLCKAGLIQRTQRGVYSLTEKGRNVFLVEKPERVDIKFLMRYPEFENFYKGKPPGPVSNGTVTPEEEIWQAYNRYKESVVNALREKIRSVDPSVFEQIVLEVLVKMGYGGNLEEAAKVVGKPGDEGIDGVIKQDPLGLDTVYIQAKRWEGTVGRPEVQKFVGALTGKGATKGVLITSGSFSDDAKNYASNLGSIKVILVDGKTLAELMYKYGVGVTTYSVLELKKIDNDYFDEFESA